MKQPPPAESSPPADRAPAESAAGPAPIAATTLPALSPEQTAELQRQAAAAAENWDKFLRAQADLENYRKRVARERQELIRNTREEVFVAVLPVLDNLERAIEAAREHAGEDNPLLAGVQQIYAQFQRCLQELGIEEVPVVAGQAFDPHLHDAVGHAESTDHPDGAILQQLQRGYRGPDRLLRPARVILSRAPTPPPTS